MKKIKIGNKLTLNKEAVSNLNDLEIENIKGGAKKSDFVKCELKTYYHCTGCLCPTSIGPSCGKFC